MLVEQELEHVTYRCDTKSAAIRKSGRRDLREIFAVGYTDATKLAPSSQFT